MIDNLRLAEMLCTRLCHDLTGPIGALSNGAEFLREEGFDLQSQAVELISTSAFSAVSRLQFYRMAYGRVKENGEASLAESHRVAVDYFAGTKIKLEWPEEYLDAVKISVSQRMMRLIFNLLIIASACLLKGGTISIRLMEENGERVAEVKAEGPAVKWEKESEALLTQPSNVENVEPKSVQLYLTHELAEEIQGALKVTASDNCVIFTTRQRLSADIAKAS